MPDGETPIPPFWINDRDHHGRPLEPAVIEAARAIWDRARREVIFKLKDPGRVPEISEAAALPDTREWPPPSRGKTTRLRRRQLRLTALAQGCGFGALGAESSL